MQSSLKRKREKMIIITLIAEKNLSCVLDLHVRAQKSSLTTYRISLIARAV